MFCSPFNTLFSPFSISCSPFRPWLVLGLCCCSLLYSLTYLLCYSLLLALVVESLVSLLATFFIPQVLLCYLMAEMFFSLYPSVFVGLISLPLPRQILLSLSISSSIFSLQGSFINRRP